MDSTLSSENFIGIQLNDTNMIIKSDADNIYNTSSLLVPPLDTHLNLYDHKHSTILPLPTDLQEPNLQKRMEDILQVPIKMEITDYSLNKYGYQSNNTVQGICADSSIKPPYDYQQDPMYHIYNKSNLIETTSTNTDDDNLFKCKYCEKSFKQRGHLINHERIHETVYDDKQFTAPVSKPLPVPPESTTVCDGKPFHCSYCGKPFKRKRDMTNHERIHTGEKPYKCMYCLKAFSQIGAKNRHEHTHTGQKPYRCSYAYCDKTFKRRGDMVSHERTHSGEKPYKCMYCEKTFAQTGSKYNHERLHTGEGHATGSTLNTSLHEDHIQR